MNCWEGCLALVVRGVDAGKQVTCLELIAPGSLVPGQEDIPATYENRFDMTEGYIWRVDRPLKWESVHQGSDGLPFAADAILRPLTPRGVVKQLFTLEGQVEDQEARLAKRVKVRTHD